MLRVDSYQSCSPTYPSPAMQMGIIDVINLPESEQYCSDSRV
jgi:hypothetical protein